MQALFNVLRPKNSFLVQRLVKFDKINLDYKYPKVGSRVLHKGVDDDEGVTVEDLLDAVRQKNTSLVREMIKLDRIKIFLDYSDPEDEEPTALHLAASLGSLEIVKILVEEGRASMGCKDKFGEFPRDVAARNNHIDIVNYMAELREKRGLLFDAVVEKNSSLVQSLIKSNKSLVGFQYPSEFGGTILHLAAYVGSLEIVKILVEEGHADIRMEDDCGEVPKEAAACNGQIDIVNYLTKAGCTRDVIVLDVEKKSG